MRLSPILDLSAAGPLWFDLCAVRGQAVALDASAVERIGGLCLQVLLAAKAQWQADGVEFSIDNPSQSFLDGLGLMAAHDLAPREIAA